MELEVETNLVLNRHIKLRVVDGSIISGNLLVYESEDPYVLVLTITPDMPDLQAFLTNSEDEIIRTDIFKDDLSRELKHWMEGKYIHHPAAMVPVRIDESIMKFIKYAKTPKQEDLIMWVLSRCELHRAHNIYDLIFGGIDIEEQEDIDKLKMSIQNKYNKTASIAAARASQEEGTYTLGKNDTNKANTTNLVPEPAFSLRNGNTSYDPSPNEDLGMFELTKKLLGRSQTLSTMRNQKVKGREGATKTLNTVNFTSDHFRLCADIARARQEITSKMDERRRIIEIARIRQLQTAEKLRNIAQESKQKKENEIFLSRATQELLTLQTIEIEIAEDIKKQRNRLQRGTQRVVWTKAPHGYAHLRGSWKKGPVLGPGPLPANATTALKDPVVEKTVKRFYWDREGRRHVKDKGREGDDSESVVEKALEAIRQAAGRLSLYQLDLKGVFREMDTSGDGLLSPLEMAQGILKMGVKLDIPSVNALFKHFDPNDSGSVHYGEFVWAFFNRRSLVRQWKRNTSSMSPSEILSKFHHSDRNGNGTLNKKEFIKLLKDFQISVPDTEIEILMDRFDMDGDGEINLEEFYKFIENEQQQLEGSHSLSPTRPGVQPQASSKPLSSRQNRPERGRPVSAPRGVGGSNQPPAQKTAPKSILSNSKSNSTSYSTSHVPNQRRPPSLPHHNATAPAALQKLPLSISEQYDLEEEEESKTIMSARTAPVLTHMEGEKDDDVLWMTRMLQAQAEIEGKLGHRYFRTKTR